MANIMVSVVSADAEVFSGEARIVSARTTEGEIGILANHEPFLAVLSAGEVKIVLPNNEQIVAEADDGFISFEHNTVTIVAGSAKLV